MTERGRSEKSQWTPDRLSEFVRSVVQDGQSGDRDPDQLERFRKARAGLDAAARDIASLRRRGRRTRPA
jgi:hypothetical protein